MLAGGIFYVLTRVIFNFIFLNILNKTTDENLIGKYGMN